MKKNQIAFSGLLLLFSTSCISTDCTTQYTANSLHRGMERGSINFCKGGSDSALFTGIKDRQIAYEVSFSLTVNQFDEAFSEIRKTAENAGGMLVRIYGKQIVFKIPAAKADQILQKLKGFGKISNFRMTTDDLTDQITDTELRLANLRKLHARLTELLKKASTVKDTLAIEKELSSLTTRIEQLTAQKLKAANRVAYVSFTVTLYINQTEPGTELGTCWHFPWLKNLASLKMITSADPAFSTELPEGFAEGLISGGKNTENLTRSAAISADGCKIVLTALKTVKSATLPFWGNVIAQSLKEMHGFNNIKLQTKPDAILITAEKQKMRYLAKITLKKGCLCIKPELRIIEYFGPEKDFENHKKTVLNMQ